MNTPVIQSADTLVIGIGNVYRSDDAVGIHIARRLRNLNIAGVTIVEQVTEPTDVLEYFRSSNTIVLIDAILSKQRPGSIVRIEVKPEMSDLQRHFSSHSFSIIEAVELGSVLGWLPARLVVYGVVGKNFELSSALSPEVEQALDGIVEHIHSELLQR